MTVFKNQAEFIDGYNFHAASTCKPDSRIIVRNDWLRARVDLTCSRYKILLPTIKLRERRTHTPWKYTDCSGVVIRLNELLSTDGRQTNGIYDEIVRVGGLHPFLGFNGQVLLSTVIPDRVIRGVSKEAYAQCISELRPDYYFTPDGQNYFDRPCGSHFEVERIMAEAKYLVGAGLDARPLGLVKGCCREEAATHCRGLIEMGIDHQVLHVGNCISKTPLKVRHQILSIYREVCSIAPWLLIYGVGGRRNFRTFNRCNGYVTHSHYVFGFEKGDECLDSNKIMGNLMDIQGDLLMIEAANLNDARQASLREW